MKSRRETSCTWHCFSFARQNHRAIYWRAKEESQVDVAGINADCCPMSGPADFSDEPLLPNIKLLLWDLCRRHTSNHESVVYELVVANTSLLLELISIWTSLIISASLTKRYLYFWNKCILDWRLFTRIADGKRLNLLEGVLNIPFVFLFYLLDALTLYCLFTVEDRYAVMFHTLLFHTMVNFLMHWNGISCCRKVSYLLQHLFSCGFDQRSGPVICSSQLILTSVKIMLLSMSLAECRTCRRLLHFTCRHNAVYCAQRQMICVVFYSIPCPVDILFSSKWLFFFHELRPLV